MRRLVVAALSVGACASAEAGASAYFLGTSVYATDEGCVKLKALAAGEPKNVGTVPETLTSQGFKSWEGGCAFGVNPGAQAAQALCLADDLLRRPRALAGEEQFRARSQGPNGDGDRRRGPHEEDHRFQEM